MSDDRLTNECRHVVLLGGGVMVQLTADECPHCERTKRLQAEHERDVAIEELAHRERYWAQFDHVPKGAVEPGGEPTALERAFANEPARSIINKALHDIARCTCGSLWWETMQKNHRPGCPLNRTEKP